MLELINCLIMIFYKYKYIQELKLTPECVNNIILSCTLIYIYSLVK